MKKWKKENLKDGAEMLNKEIGEHLGLTGERVRQITIIALAKLRKTMEEQGVTFHDLLPDDVERDDE